jgi:hypothetical protein
MPSRDSPHGSLPPIGRTGVCRAAGTPAPIPQAGLGEAKPSCTASYFRNSLQTIDYRTLPNVSDHSGDDQAGGNRSPGRKVGVAWLAGPRKASPGAEFGYPDFRRESLWLKLMIFKLVREIVAEGGRRYTNGNVDRSRYRRLVDLGWLNAFPTNMSDVIMYQITQRGKAAAKRS